MSNVSTNSVTGDKIQTKNISDLYRNNYDNIFSKPVETVLKSTDTLKDSNETEKTVS